MRTITALLLLVVVLSLAGCEAMTAVSRAFGFAAPSEASNAARQVDAAVLNWLDIMLGGILGMAGEHGRAKVVRHRAKKKAARLASRSAAPLPAPSTNGKSGGLDRLPEIVDPGQS